MKLAMYIIFIFTSFLHLFAEDSVLPIDTLYSVKWGTGQEYGREYFPSNVFGLPDTSARVDIPTVDPKQVVSLGENGEIVVGWKNSYIVDGEGNDFYVFENCFTWGDGKLFAEPGIVSVSQDGVNFVQFLFDATTLSGMAGKTPTYGSGTLANGEFGGDGFDLRAIGVDSIRFIKIKDTTALVKSDTKHHYYNPVATGFDLDAIIGVHHTNKGTISSSEDTELLPYSVQLLGNTILFSKNIEKEYTLRFYNTNGELQKVTNIPLNNKALYINPNLEPGLYYVTVSGETTAIKYLSLSL